MRRLISAVLCIVLAAMSVIGIDFTVYADETQNNTATHGVYWFDPHEVGTDVTDTYVFDDSLLKGNSLEYNKQLATMTFELAVASISSEREPKTAEGYANKSRNLKAYLEDNGFLDFDTNDYYKQKPTTTSMGVACAHKRITDGEKTYTLLAIVPRSAGYESEWSGNFSIGAEGDHEGFKNGQRIVLEFAKEYVEKYGITGDIKVWTSGYSRGAAVTNLVVAALIKNASAELGNAITLEPENIYCYTFGTPNTAQDPNGEIGEYDDPAFAYIHNTWQPYDLVTIAPPAEFGFSRYGTNTHYASPENKERMLYFLQSTNPLVYDSYMNGADPDTFTPYKLDIAALAEKKIGFIPDEESYLPKTQAEFLALMEDSIVEAVRFHDKTGNSDPRSTYYNVYQGPVARLTGYYFSHTAESDALISGITGSKFAIPMGIAMYLTYLAEVYRDTYFNVEVLNDIVNELNDYISEIEASGETVPQEIKDQLAEMEKKKATSTRFGDYVDIARILTGHLYVLVIGNGLTAAGLNEEDPALYAQMTSVNDDGVPVSRILSYMLLYDRAQTPGVTFNALNEQFKHLATFIGNASSYMRPHNNEVILSWLRAQDSTYDDFTKETAAKISGYRRAYITQPEGVALSGIVRDESGNAVAEFTNGEITSRTDPWIGITTSDNGNWLRLPADQTYYIDLSTDQTASIDLKIAEYDIYTNTEVRTETSDENTDWTGLEIEPEEKITWVISAVEGSEYKLPSEADYYIDITETFTITYDLNGGTLDGESGIIEVEYEENTVIVLPEPIREGYVFDGWTEYKAGDEYTVTEDHTFVAQWKENVPAPAVYTITLDLNGGTLDGQTGIIKKQYHEGEIIRLPKPQREGYTFDYWKGSEYKAGDEYTVTEDHTFIATWKKAGKKPVDTGDTNHSVIWKLLMAASIGTFMALLFIRRRSK